MPTGLYILSADALDRIYGPDQRAAIEQRVEMVGPPQTPQTIRQNPALLENVECLFSGWGGPVLDADFLAAAPALKAVFYGAGSVAYMVTDEFWRRGITITSAAAVNAVTVAEFALSQIVFCLRHGYRYVRQIRRDGAYPADRRALWTMPGTAGSVVGLVSLGLVGRLTRDLLRVLPDVRVIAYDPYVSAEQAARLDVALVGLDELFQQADVVSLHTPLLPATRGLVTGAHFASMKEGASFLNTARGAVVREAEMVDVLRRRPDLTAVLDVTWPEPPEPGSPLYSLDNVVLTPHLAGASSIAETRRLGQAMVEELERYLSGEPLRWAVSERESATRA